MELSRKFKSNFRLREQQQFHTHAYFRQLHGGSLILPPLSVLTAVNISLHCFTAKTIDRHKILTTAVMTSSCNEQTVISEMTTGQSTAWSVTRGNGQKEEETLMSRNDCFLFNILIHTSSSHTNCKRGWDGGIRGWKRWDTQKRIKEDWSGVKKDDVKVCKKRSRAEALKISLWSRAALHIRRPRFPFLQLFQHCPIQFLEKEEVFFFFSMLSDDVIHFFTGNKKPLHPQPQPQPPVQPFETPPHAFLNSGTFSDFFAPLLSWLNCSLSTMSLF